MRGGTGRTWIGAAVAVAFVARAAWLWAEPFWRDEAWVAYVIELPVRPLATLSYAVPVGFVAAVKGLARLLPGVPPEVA